MKAATEGLAAANTAANTVASVSSILGHLSGLKLLHLRFLCGVRSDDDILDVWKEVHASPSLQEGLALLVQYLMSRMGYCHKEYFGHVDILHCSFPLCNFVVGDKFVNPRETPACPAGGMRMRTTLQGRGMSGIEWRQQMLTLQRWTHGML